ncbi:MAG: hypothetical protein AB1817_11080, partial [Chloroflexota bacterium]
MTKSITLHSHVGADGLLNLQVPLGLTNADLEIVLVVVPIAPTAKTPDALGWPPGFFEETAGAWQGERLAREPQGEYERR